VGVLEIEGPKLGRDECSPEIDVNESPKVSGNGFDGVKEGLYAGTRVVVGMISE